MYFAPLHEFVLHKQIISALILNLKSNNTIDNVDKTMDLCHELCLLFIFLVTHNPSIKCI